MNIGFVIRQLGKLLIVLSLSMAVVTIWSAISSAQFDGRAAASEWAAVLSLVSALAVGALAGFIALLMTRKSADSFLGRREALLMVALTWLVGAAFSAVPYYCWAHVFDAHVYAEHPFKSWIKCYFEAMSGLTTTGSTVLGANPNVATELDIENLPHGLLLWRATTHWLGGIGIVVLFVAVLPMVGVGSKKLFSVESSVQNASGVRPRIAETARALWIIYLVLTVAQILLLRIFGGPKMDWFNAVCHTFATLATGGFSTSSASAAHFDSAVVEWIIIAFMLLAGINFGLYYQCFVRKKLRDVLSDTELRAYLSFVMIGSVIVVWRLFGTKIVTTAGQTIDSASLSQAIRYGVFQVLSIQTTTGYCTADFNQWDYLSKTVLILLMFVGGSAGSTGGGVKVIRTIVMAKVLLAELERIFRPNVVRPVKVGKATIDPDIRQATIVYVLMILLITALGTILIMFFENWAGTEVSFATASTASVATLNNIGPGLELVGAVENFGHFSTPSLVTMSFLMALGRLEVYAILVLFVPRFWHGK